MAARRVYETPTPGYNRRLRYLLLDPRYGPKLARLNAAGQQRVQHLVNLNRGKEARELLVELDKERKHKRTTSDRAKRYAALDVPDRSEQWDDYREYWKETPEDAAEFWALYTSYVAAA